MNVGEAEIAALTRECEFFVVQAEQMQNRGVWVAIRGINNPIGTRLKEVFRPRPGNDSSIAIVSPLPWADGKGAPPSLGRE